MWNSCPRIGEKHPCDTNKTHFIVAHKEEVDACSTIGFPRGLTPLFALDAVNVYFQARMGARHRDSDPKGQSRKRYK